MNFSDSFLQEESLANEKKLGPSIPDNIREELEKNKNKDVVIETELQIPPVETSDDVDLTEDEMNVKKKRGDRGSKRKNKPENVSEAQEEQYYKLGMDSKYDVWLPPSNQSGDGKTSLNEKLGY